MLQIIGSVLEFILGNTFPFIVFACYGESWSTLSDPRCVTAYDNGRSISTGAFWLAMGATLQPAYNAQTYYGTQTAGAEEFAASFGAFTIDTRCQLLNCANPSHHNTAFFMMAMALVTFFFFLGSLRTNLVFVLVFFFIDLAFIMLMATYWTLADGKTAVAANCHIVSTMLHLLSA